MKHIGYGVTHNGKPTGIWPTSSTHAFDVRDRRRSKAPRNEQATFQVVEVFVSSPIAEPPKLAPLELKPEALA